ncbi:VOC family protein [Pseudoduganella lutea]|uniref:Glutathione transferase n=1 Tax=Pseudoduganella lutea TaxID=321985 RepID=A0A4V0Z344_9BURK|nr:VOC family protein [Pseudoduganella lutea]QBE62153.1 glutathione transferase [Pseudoduganella lutea]
MITSLNHITLAVADLDTSFAFYVETLGFRPRAKWARGAYLSVEGLWLCLTLDRHCRQGPLPEYTHIAFTVEAAQFAAHAAALAARGVTPWQRNSSEGDSLYFLDPDGHKLEIHVGSLESRLASLRREPYEGLTLFE